MRPCCFVISGFLCAMAAGVFLAAAPAAAKGCIAVFDFELADMSLDGEINGIKPEQQERLKTLTSQLRDWIDANGGTKTCKMDAVRAEALSANLSACGCVSRLAKSVGADIAIVGSVHKLSNLILNIRVDVFDAGTNRPLAKLNADIRSNTDGSWKRGLQWLIDHRLAGALAVLQKVRP